MISSETQYWEQTFRHTNLERDEIVSAQFHDCVFFHSAFAQSVFRDCRFINCIFRECDLSLVRVPGCRFAQTRFEGCKVIGVNWAEAHWPRSGLGDPIGFVECVISHSTFLGLPLPGLELKRCIAIDVDFRETDLSKSDFTGTDLFQSMFGNTNLSEADLSHARNYNICPAGNTLTQARFSLPEALSLLHSMDILLVDDD